MPMRSPASRSISGLPRPSIPFRSSTARSRKSCSRTIRRIGQRAEAAKARQHLEHISAPVLVSGPEGSLRRGVRRAIDVLRSLDGRWERSVGIGGELLEGAAIDDLNMSEAAAAYNTAPRQGAETPAHGG